MAVTERQATPTQVFSYGIVYLHFCEIKCQYLIKISYDVSSQDHHVTAFVILDTIVSCLNSPDVMHVSKRVVGTSRDKETKSLGVMGNSFTL